MIWKAHEDCPTCDQLAQDCETAATGMGASHWDCTQDDHAAHYEQWGL